MSDRCPFGYLLIKSHCITFSRFHFYCYSVCLKYIAYGGGFLISMDLSYLYGPLSQPKPYRKTSTTKTICYRYDNSEPEHCLQRGVCTSEPLQLQKRVSTTPNIWVTWQPKDWTDPIPPGGQAVHASSIESYQITVNEVSGPKDLLQTSTTIEFINKVSANVNLLTLNITSDKPKLYCVTLEVKDVADNVRQARRFFLFDNTSFITSRLDKPFYISSASVGTNYTWQTHHNDICLDWKDHFYNKFYLDNPLLSKIEPAPFGLISGVYEQTTGKLPVSGTPNVYGITHYKCSYALDNGTFSKEFPVPNFTDQHFCRNLPLKDGDTYRLKIKAVDIANHILSEERIVYIDRSLPHIEKIEFVKDGNKKLFVHIIDKVDLWKMNLQFEAYDPHSGIETVHWFFGIPDYSGDIVSGAVHVKNIDRVSIQ